MKTSSLMCNAKSGLFAVVLAAVAAMLVPASGATAADDTAAPPAPKLEDLPLQKSVSQYGITWTFDREARVGQFITGDYYVVGAVTVKAIDPAPADNVNGSMLNPQESEYHGYAGRNGVADGKPANRYKPELMTKPPVAMKPGDSLVSTITYEKGRGGRQKLYKYVVSGTAISRAAAVLTCLDAPVPPDTFRPSYSGHQKRTYRYSELHLDLLPRLEPTKSVPKFADYERLFERPWIDHVYHWGGRQIHPGENMPDYGQSVSRAVSEAALLLLCDYPAEQKKKVLTGFVQYGIDLYGVLENGGKGWPGAGGFGHGRKWPILFAGILFQHEPMMHVKAEFAEDQQTDFGECWTGARVVFTGQCPISFKARGSPERGPYEHLHPSKWPSMMGESYRRCCISNAWIGESLAARIMKAEKLWDHDAFFVYCDRWMHENDEAFLKTVRDSITCDDGKKWYDHYSNGWARQGQTWDEFVNEMWARYRPAFQPPATETWKAKAEAP